MTEYLPGGRRRIDRVLAPDFVEQLPTLSLDELRERRAEADQEEVDLSYVRRMLHGRIDVLNAERDRRQGRGPLSLTDRSDEAIVDALTQILTDSTTSQRGMGRHLSLTPSRIGEHRREAERALADLKTSNPQGLSDQELDETISELREIESRVSNSRRSVHHVCDALTEEITRRYQAAGSSIDESLIPKQPVPGS